MSSIVRFPRHYLAHCEREHCHGCHLCEGGLAYCTVCGGFEGSLPTDCPGERMTSLREELVYDGVMDYTRREGWMVHIGRQTPRLNHGGGDDGAA